MTLIAVVLSLGGKFIPLFEPLSRVSWFVGVITAFVLYVLIKKRDASGIATEHKAA
ncbi:putative allantoin permease [compost metagenome]